MSQETNHSTAIEVAQSISEEDVVSFAEDIASIPSFTGEETPISRWLHSWFDARDYETELIEVEDNRWMTTAKLPGDDVTDYELMFNGHVDIDPVPDGYEEEVGDPFDIIRDGDKLHGMGLWNQKGGVAAMIMAAEAVRKSDVELEHDLAITPVIGELQGGVGTLHLIDEGWKPDEVIITEPWGADNAVTKHAGMVNLAVHTDGIHDHDGPPGGVDAFQQMRKFIDALDDFELSTYEPWDEIPSLPWIRVGSIIGGRGETPTLSAPYWNMDRCTVILDARTVPGQDGKDIAADIAELLEEISAENPDFNYEVEHPLSNEPYRPFVHDFPAVNDPEDMPIVEAIASNYRELTGHDLPGRGVGGEDVIPSYGCDNGHWSEAGCDSVVYGPTGEGYTDSQFVSISGMLTVARVLAATAVQRCSA